MTPEQTDSFLVTRVSPIAKGDPERGVDEDHE
jgi:hypothetical protein